MSSKAFDAGKELEPELFKYTLEALNKAVDGGFGAVAYGDDNFDFVQQLKYNNAVFSAFKTHRQQNDLRNLMVDGKGKLRSFAEYRRAATPVIGNYNVNWLQTEYSTAVLRAQNAAQQRAMDANNHIQPNREWLPSTSPSPRAEHQALYGKVFAADDPILSTTYPGCLWNCKCGMRATSKPVTGGDQVKAAVKASPKAAPGLDQNPTTTGSLFGKSHPYIAKCVGGAKTRTNVELMCAKAMSERSRNDVRLFFKDFFKGKERTYAINNAAIKNITISYQDIKSITGKPHKFSYLKNQACYFLPEILKTAKYVGTSPDVKFGKPGHNTLICWHYYSFHLNGELSYLIVQAHGDNVCRVHSIQDADHFKVSKIQKKS